MSVPPPAGPPHHQAHPGPAYPGPAYPAGPAYPPRPPQTGAVAWWLGLLVFVPLPLVHFLAAGIAMAVAGRQQRTQGPLAAENGRRAANWGLTFLTASVVLWGLHVALLFLLARDEPVQGWFPLGIPITVWGILALVHPILSIVGGVRAGSGKTFAPPAIPFFRA